MEIMFGKYKGFSLEDVMDRDPSYIGWGLSKGLFSDINIKSKSIASNAYKDEQLDNELFALMHENAGDRD